MIISREFLVRIKKKSFIVSTLLLPVMMVVMVLLPIYLEKHNEKVCTVFVIDDNDYFLNQFHNTKKINFVYPGGELEELKSKCVNGECDAVLHILEGNQSNHANLYFYEDPPLSLKNGISEQMDEILFDRSLQKEFQIDRAQFAAVKNGSHSDIQTLQIDEGGKAKARMVEMNRIVGLVFGLLIYFFVFTYANQVMRSVIEEKSNRIMEVIVSSVKPFQFMLGKISGVALAGLLQFVLQIGLVIGLLFGVQAVSPQIFAPESAQQGVSALDASGMETFNVQNDSVFENIASFYSADFTVILICFLFFFLVGYLMYASLYAGVGSTVDSESDSNQFVLPISLPLIISIVVICFGMSPQSELVWWLSMIPFTSPIAMLYRLPSGVPFWELLLSGVLLVGTFVLCVWFAARIFRVGLLTYGKKVTWKDLFMWVKR